MNLLGWTALISAVVWRISSLFHSEAPLDGLRRKLGVVQNGDDTSDWGWPDNIIGDTLSCFWCLSLFFSFIISVALTISSHTDIIEGVVVWLASATGAIMIERYIGRSRARW